jgi:ABC-2 type transport system permease protein
MDTRHFDTRHVKTMYRFLMLTKAMFLVHIRDRALLFWNIAFPVFLLVIYAAIFGGDDLVGFMAWMMPGVLTANLMAFGLIGSSSTMSELRAKGVLRRLQASPMPASQLISAYIVANVGMALATSVVVILVGVFVYGVQLSAFNILLALPMILVTVLTGVALGQVISGIAPRAGAAVAIGQLFYFAQMFITDLFMPIEMMPDWVQKVGPWLPGYAMAQLVRPALADGTLATEWPRHLLLLAVYTGVALVLAARLFKWELKA